MAAGETLVCVVWPHAAPNFPAFPQRLGIVYCFNRPCALYAAAAPGSSQEGPGSEAGASEVTSPDPTSPAPHSMLPGGNAC